MAESESSNGLCCVDFCVTVSGSSFVKPEVWKLHAKLLSSAGKSKVEALSFAFPEQQVCKFTSERRCQSQVSLAYHRMCDLPLA